MMLPRLPGYDTWLTAEPEPVLACDGCERGLAVSEIALEVIDPRGDADAVFCESCARTRCEGCGKSLPADHRGIAVCDSCSEERAVRARR